MAVAEISVIPIGTGSPSISKDVAGAVSVLRSEEKLKYELTSMGTNRGWLESTGRDLGMSLNLCSFSLNPSRAAIRCSSQFRFLAQLRQSRWWCERRSSKAVRRNRFTFGVFVRTTMPSSTN